MANTPSHPFYLQHHFSDAQQQKDSAKFGMWIFLLTEILLFGGLFCAYAVFRAWNHEMFYNAHLALDRVLGTINTFILITSSLTMALAIRGLQVNKARQAALYLGATLVFAAIFLVIKYFEYEHKIHLGQLPGKYYTYTGVAGTNPHIFFSIYFVMTGLHGLHIVGGMIVIAMMLVNTLRGKYSNEYYTPVELIGLYWHLVDLIWIYLFPFLYLIG
ncbi:cytochrome c oxidase subunit 3 family protein [candidate division KSB1 bacterium]|nr:cytochrome c oxidase subunit 3 family protein [candidate division KSB1 bacterium]RQW00478.1 MAG: cytochrome c oxidase subunit 3 family protein [candidate division KSB1 bacterium]